MPSIVNNLDATPLLTPIFGAFTQVVSGVVSPRAINAQLDALIAENPGIDWKDWLPRALADETVLNDLEEFFNGRSWVNR
jgi:hypothetical protein